MVDMFMWKDDNKYMQQVAECWCGGRPLEAGQRIFERLPNEIRPKWASRILRLVIEKAEIRCAVFDQVLRTSDNRAFWANGHHVFSIVRAETLNLDEKRRTTGLSDEEDTLACILAIGELVAKVTYNATSPTDEFDEDSGWWIAASLRGFVEHLWKDEEFSKAAWLALCCKDG